MCGLVVASSLPATMHTPDAHNRSREFCPFFSYPSHKALIYLSPPLTCQRPRRHKRETHVHRSISLLPRPRPSYPRPRPAFESRAHRDVQCLPTLPTLLRSHTDLPTVVLELETPPRGRASASTIRRRLGTAERKIAARASKTEEDS